MQKNENRAGYKKMKVGWLPGDWECLPFTDVFDRVVVPLAPIETETYQEIGVRSHGKGIFHKEPVTGADIGSKRVFHCQPGALVFNIVFAWEQAVAVLSEQERDLIASHRFPMYKGKEGQAFEPFFLSFFKTRKGKNGLGIASPGGAGRNKTLGQKDMEYLYVPKPTRSEQEAIAGVLECWDRAIRNYEKKIEKKRNVKKGLMQRLLSGKQRLPGFRGEWKRVQLGEISVVNQESLAANTPADTQFYYLDLSCVNKGRITRPRAKLAFDRSPSRARRIFKKHDVLMATVRPNLLGHGYVDFDADDMVCSTGFAVISCNTSQLDSQFLYAYLFSEKLNTDIQNLLAGSSYPAINASDVTGLAIALPPIREQQAIATILSAADVEIAALERKLTALKDQKRFLLNTLVTGTLRLPQFVAEKRSLGTTGDAE